MQVAHVLKSNALFLLILWHFPTYSLLFWTVSHRTRRWESYEFTDCCPYWNIGNGMYLSNFSFEIKKVVVITTTYLHMNIRTNQQCQSLLFLPFVWKENAAMTSIARFSFHFEWNTSTGKMNYWFFIQIRYLEIIPRFSFRHHLFVKEKPLFTSHTFVIASPTTGSSILSVTKTKTRGATLRVMEGRIRALHNKGCI